MKVVPATPHFAFRPHDITAALDPAAAREFEAAIEAAVSHGGVDAADQVLIVLESWTRSLSLITDENAQRAIEAHIEAHATKGRATRSE